MEGKLPLLRRSLERSLVVKRGEYNYLINPLTDTIPPLEPALLREVADAVASAADCDVDVIVTMEAMGIHLAALLSQKTGKPFNIVRKRQYRLPGEVVLDQSTGYGKGSMYINGLMRGQRVLVVDSVLSTGGTLVAVLEGLKKAGVEVKDVVCVIEKGDGRRVVREKTGFDVKTLVKIDVSADGVRVL